MKEAPTWLIIGTGTRRPIYGYENKTMVFSTQDVAHEIATQLFKTKEEFMIIQIPDIKLK